MHWPFHAISIFPYFHTPNRTRGWIRCWRPLDATFAEWCRVEETVKSARECRHPSPSGSFEHDAHRHSVHLECHLNRLGCTSAEARPCIELTPEQRDLSEAEESYETSGTKRMWRASLSTCASPFPYIGAPAPVMDIVVSRQRHPRPLAGGQQGRELKVRWLPFDRSWGPSNSYEIYGVHLVVLDGL